MSAEPNRNEPTIAEGGATGPPTHELPPPAQTRARIDDPRRKSTVLAVVLSAMPGLGQVYVGYYPRGFTHAFVVAGLIALLSSMHEFSPLFPLGVIFLIFFWLYNMIDAGRRAAMYNVMLEGGEILDLPEDIRMPGLRGSIVGGVAIIAVGVIILSNTAFDVPLDWLENWWPAAVVIFGVYLVVKGMTESAETRRDRPTPTLE